MILSRTGPAAATLCALLVLFVALRPLLPIDETRYLDVAWEMWLTGDAFHLTRNFELYTHKPPLLFWLINLVWAGTGVNEFAARLVAPAFAVALAVATARLGRRLWPADAGIGARSVWVLCGFTVFLVYASATMFDTMLALATVLGVGVLWRIGQGSSGWRDWLALGAAFAFGVYAKGPVIFVHLIAVFVAMPLWAGAAPRLPARLAGLAVALAAGLVLVGLWLAPALLGGSAAYREELLWTQSAARIAGGMAHDRPVWFLIVLMPILLFPWGWSGAFWRAAAAEVRRDRAARMLALWAGGALVLFSLISGKQAHYLVPEYPAVALLVARYLPAPGARRRFPLAALVPLAVGLGGLAVAAGLVPAARDVVAGTPVAALAGLALFALGLAMLGWVLPPAVGFTVIGAGLALAAHLLVATSGLYAGYDAGRVAARIAAAGAEGLAVAGMSYNAEFNFAAGLTEPVATPATAADLRRWSEDHPAGLVIGPVGRVPVASAPEDTLRYNRLTYGFWPARAVALSVRE